jgi:hypothetical protein
VLAMSLRARFLRSSFSPLLSCHRTTLAAKPSIDESKPKPTRAMEPAAIPAPIEATASMTFQVMVKYSSLIAR